MSGATAVRERGLGPAALGRMLSLAKGGATTSYAYRADGMRVAKSSPCVAELYRYDGQMPVETVETAGGATTVQRNALGARGTDMIERAASAGTQTRFPLYDAHGNSVATLGPERDLVDARRRAELRRLGQSPPRGADGGSVLALLREPRARAGRRVGPGVHEGEVLRAGDGEVYQRGQRSLWVELVWLLFE